MPIQVNYKEYIKKHNNIQNFNFNFFFFLNNKFDNLLKSFRRLERCFIFS
jgi:hypothetical protein